MKANHHSKNGVTIVVDMDITLLNADKNNKIIRTNHMIIENQINHYINTRKKTKFYQIKTKTIIIVQENHFQITIIPLDNNYLTEITTAKNLHIKEIRESSHKTDKVNQTVKTINIEIIIQDQTQTEVITVITIEIVHIQTPDTDIIQMNVLKISHIIVKSLSNNRNRQYPGNKTRNYSNNRSNYNNYPGTEILVTQTDKIVLSHHIEFIHNIKIQNKTIEVAHLKIKKKSTKNNQLKKPTRHSWY